jgi:hypothetical protein
MQAIDATTAVVESATEACRFTTLFGRAEQSDGTAALLYRVKAAADGGLEADALARAMGESTEPGVWAGTIQRLLLLAHPVIAHQGPDAEAVWVSHQPLDDAGTPPDPLRPGPLRVELNPAPSRMLTLRVHLSPVLAAGITGVLNAPRVLAFLSRLSNRGFLPASDPAARLPAPAPIVEERWTEGVKVTWTQRPGDALPTAAFEAPDPALIPPIRDALAAATGEDALAAAPLTTPTGPIPAKR